MHTSAIHFLPLYDLIHKFMPVDLPEREVRGKGGGWGRGGKKGERVRG